MDTGPNDDSDERRRAQQDCSRGLQMTLGIGLAPHRLENIAK
jgi:hypothetical protein